MEIRFLSRFACRTQNITQHSLARLMFCFDGILTKLASNILLSTLRKQSHLAMLRLVIKSEAMAFDKIPSKFRKCSNY